MLCPALCTGELLVLYISGIVVEKMKSAVMMVGMLTYFCLSLPCKDTWKMLDSHFI